MDLVSVITDTRVLSAVTPLLYNDSTDLLYPSIVRVVIAADELEPFLRSLVQWELNSTESEETFMREKSVPQMLLCTCGKMMEQGFLLHTVRPFVLEVVRLCEQENYDFSSPLAKEQLDSIALRMTSSFTEHSEYLSPATLLILGEMSKRFTARFPKVDGRQMSFCAYLFLRIVCPSITDPGSFNLLRGGHTLSLTALRSLAHVSKRILSACAPDSLIDNDCSELEKRLHMRLKCFWEITRTSLYDSSDDADVAVRSCSHQPLGSSKSSARLGRLFKRKKKSPKDQMEAELPKRSSSFTIAAMQRRVSTPALFDSHSSAGSSRAKLDNGGEARPLSSGSSLDRVKRPSRKHDEGQTTSDERIIVEYLGRHLVDLTQALRRSDHPDRDECAASLRTILTKYHHGGNSVRRKSSKRGCKMCAAPECAVKAQLATFENCDAGECEVDLPSLMHHIVNLEQLTPKTYHWGGKGEFISCVRGSLLSFVIQSTFNVSQSVACIVGDRLLASGLIRGHFRAASQDSFQANRTATYSIQGTSDEEQRESASPDECEQCRSSYCILLDASLSLNEMLAHNNLLALCAHFCAPGTGVQVKTRRWLLRVYRDCFVGNQAVTWFQSALDLETRSQAVVASQRLFHANLVHHVMYDHELEDEYYFYQFVPHSDKDPSAVNPLDHLSLPELAKHTRGALGKKFSGSDLLEWLEATYSVDTIQAMCAASNLLRGKYISSKHMRVRLLGSKSVFSPLVDYELSKGAQMHAAVSASE